jgi:hypothetical protein
MYGSRSPDAATIGMRATKFANEGEGAAWYASNEAVGLGRAVSSSFSFFTPLVSVSRAGSPAPTLQFAAKLVTPCFPGLSGKMIPRPLLGNM